MYSSANLIYLITVENESKQLSAILIKVGPDAAMPINKNFFILAVVREIGV